MLTALAQWVNSTRLSVSLAGSTWGYPLIGGLHVLGVAWFGGAVLLSVLKGREPGGRPRAAWMWTGAAFMLLTGGLLFVIEPLRCASSRSFEVKVAALIALIALAAMGGARSKLGVGVIWTLWAVVLLASRGIAFF